MISANIINWLMEGDVAIQYQTSRDLLQNDDRKKQLRIENEGWGFEILQKRLPDGNWGKSFYQPKWTSTHYTLLLLKNLGISSRNALVRQSLANILEKEKGPDGGINPSGTIQQSDVWVNGMVLSYGCYFGAKKSQLKSVVDFLLSQQMPDGGFNCRLNRSGAVHSSLHTTISVLEGILEYSNQGYQYRLNELMRVKAEAEAFILIHRLYRSDKTCRVIHANFLKFHFPCYWYYDILKAMDYFQCAAVKYEERMKDALEFIITKRDPNGLWKLASGHPGKTHLQMEKAGKPSRWITLRALRVLQYYNCI